MLYPFVLSIDSNVVFEGSAITSILDYVIRLLEVFAISVAYSVIIVGIYRFGAKSFKIGAWIFVASTAFKYLANTFVLWGMSGGIPIDFLFELADVLYFTVLEGAQLLIFWLISNKILFKRKHQEELFARVGAKAEGGKKLPCLYPFEKIYDRENCILRSAFVGAIIVFASKALGLFLNDVWAIMLGGLPQKAVTVALMLLNYLSCIIFGAVSYFISYFCLSKLLDKSENI